MHSDYETQDVKARNSDQLNLKEYHLKYILNTTASSGQSCRNSPIGREPTAYLLTTKLPLPTMPFQSQFQYLAETPAGDLVPQSIVNFFKKFYILSDSPDQHREYANCFTKDGVMVLGSSRTEGREGR